MNEFDKLVETVRGTEIKTIDKEFSSLEAMNEEGLNYARAMLIDGDPQSELVPTWTLVSNNGQITMMATPFDAPDAKDKIALMVRALVKAAGIVRYSFACECWMAMPAEKKWDGRPISQRDDRIEAVMITTADREETIVNTYEIKRGDDGAIVELVDRAVPGLGKTSSSGRFANMFDDEEIPLAS